MKLLKSTLFSVLAAAVALAGCQREAIDPDAQTPGQGEEIVIPVSVEGAIPVDGTLSAADTKVTVNPTTGATAWQENDQVAVWLYNTGTSSGSYVSAKVKDSAIHLNMTTAQQRQGYAVYPAGQQAGDGSTAKVVYPASYNMNGKDVTAANTWAPTPMVALNAQGKDLNFFHVGGLLRLHVTEVPSGTTGLSVTFVSDDPTNYPIYVTGTFNVANPGTLSASTSYDTGGTDGTSVITFSNISGIQNSEVYLNIPLPTIDFSHLSAIQVSNTNGTVYTAEARLTGWGSLGHAQGKKLPMSFFSIDFLPGYDGTFRGGIQIAPGYLVWDTDASAYKLSDPDDPFYPIRFYGGATADALNIVYHKWTSLKSRLDGNTSDTDIVNGAVIDGETWSVPSKSQFERLIANGTSSTINGTAAAYCMVRVNLSGATSVGEDNYDYSVKGLNKASGDAVTANNGGYQVGLLLVPDYTSIRYPGMTANNKSFGSGPILSWFALQKFLDAGCVFLPAAGYIGWVNGGRGYYWSSTRSSSSNACNLIFDGNVYFGDYMKNDGDPVFLVRE